MLARELEEGTVVVHPFVIGEVACGLLSTRDETLSLMQELPAAPVADHREALSFIERHTLAGRGLGYIDVHLLASVALGDRITLWTRDRRRGDAATRLNLAYVARA
jgi:predicted nucleic acid-binding protein